MKRRRFVKNTVLAGIGLTAANKLSAILSRPSSFLKIIPDKQWPRFTFFSIDSLGKNKLQQNTALATATTTQLKYTSKQSGNTTLYQLIGHKNKPAWKFTQHEKSFSIAAEYIDGHTDPFVINFNQHENHATLLGLIKGPDAKVSLPAILHLPDMGSLQVTCNVPGQTLAYSSQRFIEFPFVKIELPAATAENKKIEYQFTVVTIYPDLPGLPTDDRYDCFRKNFISIFQVNPFLKILANNSASDACAFTLFKYSEVALHAPPLANGLTAMDLIKMTLDRYLNGTLGYGMLGYDYDKTWDIPESDTRCNSLDSFPSLLISACNYAISTNDKKWFVDNYSKLNVWIGKMLNTDKDQDGLLEFCLSGNSGSWKGDKTMRPSNWWDTIGFGHKDAYSNALAYRALILLDLAHQQFEMNGEAKLYRSKAALLKENYTRTFYNEATGVLAGWKSADGKLHDYWFTFVNAVAISYGLIENKLANSIMDNLLAKMKAVGFTNFELGLPGNLIPVIRADYTDHLLEVGAGKREDNLDGFQIYLNGGATACYTYFTIDALQKLGRKKDADAILLPLLKSMSEGGFQGRCPETGRTKDWKTWSGECWGYEGFLVDNYLFLLCVLRQI